MSLTRSMKAQNWQTLLTHPVGHTTAGNYVKTQPLISSELCPSVGIIVALTNFPCVWITPKHVVLLPAGGKNTRPRGAFYGQPGWFHMGHLLSKRSLGSNVGLCSFWPLHQGRGEVCTCVCLPTTVIVLRASQCARAQAVGKYCLPTLQWERRAAYEQNESQEETYGWKPQKPSVSGQPGIHIKLKSNLCLLV